MAIIEGDSSSSAEAGEEESVEASKKRAHAKDVSGVRLRRFCRRFGLVVDRFFILTMAPTIQQLQF